MSLEAEIKALIESFKIGQTFERKVNCLCRKDNEFNILQADTFRLKSIKKKQKKKSIGKSIVEIQKDDKNLMCSNKVIFLESKYLN